MHGYKPEAGKMATVCLPGEITRGTIESVISDTAIIIKIATFTTSKDHPYRRGDLVPCELEIDGMNQVRWIAIDERGLRVQPQRQPDPEPPALEEPKPFLQPIEATDPSFILSEN